MPKIEKDLLKVKGSDGQWHYVPAVGGSVDTAPTWDAVQNKPFSTLGSGLSVDEDGVLSAQGGGGSANAVQYVAQELTDEQKAQARENIGAKAATEKSAYIISKTRSYGYIHTNGMDFDRVYAQIQSGKVVMLLVDDSSTYYGVITPTNVADKTIMFYNIKDISPSDVGRRNKGIEYFGFTWHKGDDSLTEWFGDIPRVEVDSTLTESGSAADAKAVGDALQNYVPAENYEENLQEIAQAIDTKLDKNQGAGNAGKFLGIGEDGNVIPQDKPTYTLTDADKTAVADAVVADGIAATLVDLPSGGGGGTYRLVSDTTLSEAVETITISQDKDGNAFELTDCLVWVFATVTEASQLVVIPNGYWTNGTYFAFANKTATDYAYDYVAYCHGSDDSFYGYAIRDKAASPGMNAAYNSQRASNPIKSKITLIKLNCKFAAGARILIYGR